METTLLTLGVLLVLVGLVGQVKAKEIEVGTKNPLVRIILGVIGVVFVCLALSKSYLPNLSTSPSTPVKSDLPNVPASPPTPVKSDLPKVPASPPKPVKSDLPKVPASPPKELPKPSPAPTSAPPSSGTESTLSTLYLRVVAVPQSVKPGEKAAIYVTVSDQKNRKVDGAKVLVEAGGGKFLETADTTYDPNANLHGPFSAAGYTGLNGGYTAWWVCNPCAAGYGMSVKAAKDGYTDAVGDLTIKMR